jgi:adenylyltransferase/sulfurtransferase
MPKIYIPSALRPFVEHQSTIDLPGDTVDQVLKNLVEQYPRVHNHLLEENGKVRNFVNIFVNSEDIRFLEKEHTRVSEKDEISIVPSVAGGKDEERWEGPELSRDEILRYSRHIILPEVALDGQRKLKAARILLIGAGGLGSPLAMYLAAAGIGKLGLVDFDVVDTSNLQRQVIHKTSNIGKSKLQSAREFITEVNPNVEVVAYEAAFTSENAMAIAREYDIIIDGTDNFPTRYLVNDVSVLLGKPNVYGSIFRFEGQASVFAADRGPCYRCLYPEPPPPGMVPSCAEGGVLGVLPGVIGLIQATEAIKLILGKGDTLIGRLLLYDALAMRFREVRLRKNPDCPICGEHRTIDELIDYNAFCGVPGAEHEEQVDPAIEVSATELSEKLAQNHVFLLDVREPYEWQIGYIAGATLIPLGDLPARLNEIDGTKEIVTYCRTGVRSLKALQILRNAGFFSTRHLKGGIHAWSDAIDATIPKY